MRFLSNASRSKSRLPRAHTPLCSRWLVTSFCQFSYRYLPGRSKRGTSVSRTRAEGDLECHRRRLILPTPTHLARRRGFSPEWWHRMQEETEIVSLAQHPQPVFGYRKPFTHPHRGMRFPFQRRVDRVHKKEKFPKENEALSAPLQRKDPDERAGFLSASHRSNSKSRRVFGAAPRSSLIFGWRL